MPCEGCPQSQDWEWSVHSWWADCSKEVWKIGAWQRRQSKEKGALHSWGKKKAPGWNPPDNYAKTQRIHKTASRWILRRNVSAWGLPQTGSFERVRWNRGAHCHVPETQQNSETCRSACVAWSLNCGIMAIWYSWYRAFMTLHCTSHQRNILRGPGKWVGTSNNLKPEIHIVGRCKSSDIEYIASSMWKHDMAQHCRHLRLDSKTGEYIFFALFVGCMLLCVMNLIMLSDASTFHCKTNNNWSWEDPLARRTLWHRNQNHCKGRRKKNCK